MKKITSLLAIMLLMVANSVLAQYKPGESVAPVPGTDYLLTNSDMSYYVTYSGAMTASAEDDTYLWQVEATGNANEYYLKASNGEYIQLYDASAVDGGLDGYDVFGYAGFNFSLGAKATAMPMLITYSDGVVTIKCNQTLTWSGEEKDFYLANQGNNVAMDPYTAGGQQWMFMTCAAKNLTDLINDLVESCSETKYLAGTTGGYYDAQKVATYEAALAEAEAVVAGEAEPTQEIYDNLKNAIADVKDSMIPYNGWYNFVNCCPFATDKGMYADKTNMLAKWMDLDETNPAFAWQITQNEDGSYTIKNMYGEIYLSECKTSTNVALVAADAKTQKIVAIPTGYEAFEIPTAKIGPSDATDYQYYHCGGHGGGSGTSGNIVGWANSSYDDATAWKMQVISDEQVEVLLQKVEEEKEAEKQAEIDTKLAELVATATSKYDMNIDKTNVLSEGLITDEAQINANGTQETSEGTIASLIDGHCNGTFTDPETGESTTYDFYHSSWSAATEDYHSLTFEFTDPQEFVSFMSMRRCGQNLSPNRPTFVELYGSNDGENWQKAWILSTELPSANVGTADTTYNSMAIDLGAAYTYLKFVVKKTNNMQNADGTHPFFTYSELQWYTAEVAADAKIKSMSGAPALLAAIRQALTAEKATQEDIDALQKALDEFAEDFADPTDLKAAIASAKVKYNAAVVGIDAGQYPQEAKDALGAAIEEAEAVLETEYTKATLKTALDNLNAAVAEFDAAVIKAITPNHWYYIKTHASNTVVANGYIYSHPEEVTVDETTWGGNHCYHWTTSVPTVETVGEDNISVIRGYIFRFVPTEQENVFAIQDANGLFINNDEQGSDGKSDAGIIGTGFTHKLFKVYESTMGEGGYEIRVADDSQAALHTSASGRLVNWANNGNKGSFYFISVPEEQLTSVGLNGADYATEDDIWTEVSLTEGWQIVTCPVEVLGAYGSAYYVVEDDGDEDLESEDGELTVTLKLYGEGDIFETPIPAGTPFFYNAPAEGDMFIYGTSASTVGKKEGKLVGTLTQTTGLTDAWNVNADGNLVKTTTSAAYSGYYWNTGLKGDVNGDSVVDIADVNAILTVMFSEEGYSQAADVNGDGDVDIADVNAVLTIIFTED